MRCAMRRLRKEDWGRGREPEREGAREHRGNQGRGDEDERASTAREETTSSSTPHGRAAERDERQSPCCSSYCLLLRARARPIVRAAAAARQVNSGNRIPIHPGPPSSVQRPASAGPASPSPRTPQLSSRKPKSSTGMDQHTLFRPPPLRARAAGGARWAILSILLLRPNFCALGGAGAASRMGVRGSDDRGQMGIGMGIGGALARPGYPVVCLIQRLCSTLSLALSLSLSPISPAPARVHHLQTRTNPTRSSPQLHGAPPHLAKTTHIIPPSEEAQLQTIDSLRY
jgi:hypothetical protein